jgi:protein tyrosine phosphatase (PTP) superfamily phosphohydrolase (DUF442 family)
MSEDRQTAKSGGPGKRSVLLKRVGIVLGCVAVCLAGLHVAQVLLGGAGVFSVGGSFDTGVKVGRPGNWAQRMELAGVDNFHKVCDTLYRGAQPSKEGMRELKKLGIKTVVSLRSFHSDRDEIGETQLDYEHIYAKAWHIEDKEVVRFLKIVTDPNRTPVFVHCQRGADRTGTMCAIYRIAIQGWSKEAAIEEMTKGGFGFYSGFENLVEYINDLDIKQMKLRAGLKE